MFGGFSAKPAGTFGTNTTFGQPATGGTSAFGGFGQPQQQQNATGQPAQQTSIFGQPQQQQQQQQPSPFGASSAFGGATNTTQPANNIFGGGNTQAQNQGQAAPSIFGSTPAQNQPTSSIFGSTQNQNQNQAQAGGTSSIFGSTQAQTQPTTSLFGQTQTQTQPQSSIFGGAQPQGQTQQPANNNMFGSNSSPFGQTQTQQPASNTFGGFGASTAQPAAQTSTFGASTNTNPLFGQKPAQSNLGLSTTQQQAPLFTRSTKFNDLPDEVKRIFESLDSHIQGRIQIGKDLQQQKLGEESMKGQELIRSVHKELVHTSSLIHSDHQFNADIKAKVDQAVQDTIIATRIVDGFKNPQQHGAYLKNYASFPLEYFSRVAHQMQERLRWFQTTIEQIERKLALTANHAHQSPQAITATLQAQHSTFITLANKTALLHAELEKIKHLYTQLWRARTGSVRDPFSDVDRAAGGDFGLSSMQV